MHYFFSTELFKVDNTFPAPSLGNSWPLRAGWPCVGGILGRIQNLGNTHDLLLALHAIAKSLHNMDQRFCKHHMTTALPGLWIQGRERSYWKISDINTNRLTQPMCCFMCENWPVYQQVLCKRPLRNGAPCPGYVYTSWLWWKIVAACYHVVVMLVIWYTLLLYTGRCKSDQAPSQLETKEDHLQWKDDIWWMTWLPGEDSNLYSLINQSINSVLQKNAYYYIK